MGEQEGREARTEPCQPYCSTEMGHGIAALLIFSSLLSSVLTCLPFSASLCCALCQGVLHCGSLERERERESEGEREKKRKEIKRGRKCKL